MKRIKLLIIGLVILVLSMGIVSYAMLSSKNAATGISSVNIASLPKTLVQPSVTGKVYGLNDVYAVTATTRFSAKTVPSGWHVTEDSGTGSEAAVYNLETDDKKAKIKTVNLASAYAAQYTSISKCSEELTLRYSSSDYLESFSGAVKGSVTTGSYTTYTVLTSDGNGVEMGRVDYSYKDTAGVTQYATRLLRCGSTSILSVVVSSADKERVASAIVEVVKELVVKS